jgi:hypothetical protein
MGAGPVVAQPRPRKTALTFIPRHAWQREPTAKPVAFMPEGPLRTCMAFLSNRPKRLQENIMHDEGV